MAHCASMLGPPRLRNRRPSAWTAFGVAAPLALCAVAGHARTLDVHVDLLRSSVAAASGLHARLDWPDGAASGVLRVDADTVDAQGLGYAFSALHWECPLFRDGKGRWRCEGQVRAGAAKPMRLALSLSSATLAVRVSDGPAAVSLQRDAATPDNTRLLFEQVPSAWLAAFVANLWTKGQLK